MRKFFSRKKKEEKELPSGGLSGLSSKKSSIKKKTSSKKKKSSKYSSFASSYASSAPAKIPSPPAPEGLFSKKMNKKKSPGLPKTKISSEKRSKTASSNRPKSSQLKTPQQRQQRAGGLRHTTLPQAERDRQRAILEGLVALYRRDPSKTGTIRVLCRSHGVSLRNQSSVLAGFMPSHKETDPFTFRLDVAERMAAEVVFGSDSEFKRAVEDASALARQAGGSTLSSCRLLVVGQGRSGKTAMVRGLMGQAFEQTSSTIGVERFDVRVAKLVADGQSTWKNDQGGKRSRLAQAHAVQAAEVIRRQKLGAAAGAAGIAGGGQSQAMILDDLVPTQLPQLPPPNKREEEEEAPTCAISDGSGQKQALNSGCDDDAPDDGSSKGKGEAAAAPPAGDQKEGKQKKQEKKTARKLRGATERVQKEVTEAAVANGQAEQQQKGEERQERKEGAGGAGKNKAEAKRLEAQEKEEEELGPKQMESLVRQFLDEDGTKKALSMHVWDFGGQEIFYSLHHLFLSRYGIYLVLFNLEWLAPSATPQQRKDCLSFLRFWLSSIAVNATDVMNAGHNFPPVFLVGTHKDRIGSPAQHEAISHSLHDAFAHLPVWPAVEPFTEGEVSTGRGLLWFFPVDNTKGREDRVFQLIMQQVEAAARAEEYMQKLIPYAWLRFLDRLLLLAKTRGVCSLKEAQAMARQSGLPASPKLSLAQETSGALRFFNGLGLILYLEDPALRSLVLLDATKFLIQNATMVIRESRIHVRPQHREAQRLFPGQWRQLHTEAILDARLLAPLWPDLSPTRRTQVLRLMVLYGLVVPLRPQPGQGGQHEDGAPDADEEDVDAGRLLQRAPSGIVRETARDLRRERAAFRGLVPSLLPNKPLTEFGGGQPAAVKTAYIVFAADDALLKRDAVAFSELATQGFCPNGVFARVLGKAVQYGESTDGMQPMTSLNEATLSFGQLVFTIQSLPEHNCVRLHTKHANPSGLVERILLQVQEVISECSLRLFAAALVPTTDDFKQVEAGKGGQLVALSRIKRRVQENKYLHIVDRFLYPKDLAEVFGAWLPPSGLLEAYDVFISYRWGPRDSIFTAKLFDFLSRETLNANNNNNNNNNSGGGGGGARDGGSSSDGATRRVETFLDTARLESGRRFRNGFMDAMRRSCGVVPVVSMDALKRMRILHADSPIDNVLLEWVLALELSLAGNLPFVLPVLIGDRTQPAADPDADGGEGEDEGSKAGVGVESFFRSADLESLPDVVVSSVTGEVRAFLLKLGMGPGSARLGTRTVRQTVLELIEFKAVEAKAALTEYWRKRGGADRGGGDGAAADGGGDGGGMHALDMRGLQLVVKEECMAVLRREQGRQHRHTHAPLTQQQQQLEAKAEINVTSTTAVEAAGQGSGWQGGGSSVTLQASEVLSLLLQAIEAPGGGAALAQALDQLGFVRRGPSGGGGGAEGVVAEDTAGGGDVQAAQQQ